MVVSHYDFYMTVHIHLSVLISQPDPKQKTIYELFQRTFSDSEDDTDVALLEAADACCEFDSDSAFQDAEERCSVSSLKKRRTEEFIKE